VRRGGIKGGWGKERKETTCFNRIVAGCRCKVPRIGQKEAWERSKGSNFGVEREKKVSWGFGKNGLRTSKRKDKDREKELEDKGGVKKGKWMGPHEDCQNCHQL